MKYADSIVDLIGNTPLVKLNRVTEGIAATVLVKVEYLNPGGSIKDRIAAKMIAAAEASGELKPGGTIVEPTSGNTGVGLALVAQQKGYRCIFVTPDKVGEEKRAVLRAYGAEVVVTPTSVSPEDPQSYYSVSDRLVAEIPGAFKPNQFFNENGPLSHYESTGPEIWNDTEGKVTHVVIGAGTGGTISGTGRYLKEVSDGAVKVIGADPLGSIYSGGTGRPYLVEGVGEDMWPGTYHPDVIDEVLAADDAEAFELTRRLAREEGLLVGGSSGMAVAVGLRVARELSADDVVVIILPDSGRGYLGKVFSDDWMNQHGFATTKPEGQVLADVLDETSLPHLRPEHTVAEAAAALALSGFSTLPVLVADLPVVLGEVRGSVSTDDLVDGLLDGSLGKDTPIGNGFGPRPALIGSGYTVEAAQEAIAEHGTVLVLTDAQPRALLDSASLLALLTA